MKNKDLKRRIIDISYKKKLSHLGSCLTAVDIIDEIYATKKPDEKFILSSGHAGLALYVVLEKYQEPYRKSAEEIFDHHGVHPDHCDSCGIDCSSGSLGHGFGIAVGMALADRSKNVYCLVSDGEMAEGSIWEAMRIKTQYKVNNLKIYLNYNGFAAYQESYSYFNLEDHSGKDGDGNWLQVPTQSWLVENMRRNFLVEWPAWLKTQEAHYAVMDEKRYKEALEVLN